MHYAHVRKVIRIFYTLYCPFSNRKSGIYRPKIIATSMPSALVTYNLADFAGVSERFKIPVLSPPDLLRKVKR